MFLRPPHPIALAGLLLALSAGTAQAVTNLVQNPGFDNNLAGWSTVNTLYTKTERSPLDAHGSPSSGSVKVSLKNGTAYDYNFAASQCIPVTPGLAYLFSGDIYIPAEETNGAVFLNYYQYTDGACTNLYGGFGMSTDGERGRWVHVFNGPIIIYSQIHSVRVGAAAETFASGASFVGHVDNVLFALSKCLPDAVTSCLSEGRFKITATYRAANGSNGAAHVDRLTNDSTALWFFSAQNLEALVKVINGCAVNGRFWVYAGGLTDQRVELTVTDTETGLSHTWVNPLGTGFKIIRDTSTFATCP